MSKTKMRCITCSKWFQSANAKEVTCPECTQKARREKMALKNAPATSNKATEVSKPSSVTPVRPPVPPKPKSAHSGTSHWLDSLSDIKVAQPEPPPAHPKVHTPPIPHDHGSEPGTYRPASEPNAYRDEQYTEDSRRSANPRGGTISAGIPGQRPRQPMNSDVTHKPHPRPKAKSATPPKPKKEKIPPPSPFIPTSEQIAQVENHYLELATPREFDGIRTQIAKELALPKKAVKNIIKDLRDRQDIPSWWDLQTYQGNAEELQRIKSAYEPLLPVPPVGAHKKLAEELSLKPGDMYQAIKAIRQEMKLPQYNDPTLHAEMGTAQSVSHEQASFHAATTEVTPPALQEKEAGEASESAVSIATDSDSDKTKKIE